MQISENKLKKIPFAIWGFFLHKSSVLLISLTIFMRSFNFQIDNCFLTRGLSFQKIEGLIELIRLSTLLEFNQR